MRICSGAGCLRVVADDVRFCDTCTPYVPTQDDGIREHTLTDRVRYAALYSSARWQRLRKLVARSQPMCARCHNRITVIVDHVVPAGVAIAQARDSGKCVDRHAGFFIRSNLQGLCVPCHYTKTVEDKTHSGEWRDVLAFESLQPPKKWSF